MRPKEQRSANLLVLVGGIGLLISAPSVAEPQEPDLVTTWYYPGAYPAPGMDFVRTRDLPTPSPVLRVVWPFAGSLGEPVMDSNNDDVVVCGPWNSSGMIGRVSRIGAVSTIYAGSNVSFALLVTYSPGQSFQLRVSFPDDSGMQYVGAAR
jgi:hypothetical protein